MLWKAEEWKQNGKWYCNCVSNLGKDSGLWYHPARILGISPAAFLELLITKYKPDNFYYNKKSGFCSWSWSSQKQMRTFKNWINAEARKKNYQI